MFGARVPHPTTRTAIVMAGRAGREPVGRSGQRPPRRLPHLRPLTRAGTTRTGRSLAASWPSSAGRLLCLHFTFLVPPSFDLSVETVAQAGLESVLPAWCGVAFS